MGESPPPSVVLSAVYPDDENPWPATATETLPHTEPAPDLSLFSLVSQPPLTKEEEEEKKDGSWMKMLKTLMLSIIILLMGLLLLPIYLLEAVGSFLFWGVNVGNWMESDDKEQEQEQKEGLYQKALEFRRNARIEVMLMLAIWKRLLLMSLILLFPALVVPGLRRRTLLGSMAWQWILLFMLTSCGYPLVTVLTRLMLFLIFSFRRFNAKKNALYFARGLRRTFNFIILSGLVLVAWECHFRTSVPGSRVLDTMTWTVVSVFVGAVLWMVKTALLLNWQADAVYRRFSHRILTVGYQLYYIGLIHGRRFDDFQPYKSCNPDATANADADYTPSASVEDPEQIMPDQPPFQDNHRISESGLISSSAAPTQDDYSGNVVTGMTSTGSRAWKSEGRASYRRTETWRMRQGREDEEEKRKAKDVLMKHRKVSQEATTYDIKQKAKYFINLYLLSSREGDGISDLQNKFDEKISTDTKWISKNDLMNNFKFDDEDANLLYLDEHWADCLVPYETFKRWMLKAHKNCLVLGCTLSDAKEVVQVLNKVMTGFLVVVVAMTWLLLTGITTTNVMLLIASPFIAATFVFGETCRRIFEGIVFSFIDHPFDVGDRCIIDGDELEVKHMSILKTTFTKVGTREETLYPNSVLATKSITNMKGEPDPDDIIELTLDSNSTNKVALDLLQSKISRFLQNDTRYEHENNNILVKGIENGIKMTVQYRHVLGVQEVTHTQCSEKKVKQRSEFLLQIKEFLDELEVKVATNIF